MKTIQWSEIELGDTIAIQYFNGDSVLVGRMLGSDKGGSTIKVGETNFTIKRTDEWEILWVEKPEPLPATAGSIVRFSESTWILLPVYVTLIGRSKEDEVAHANPLELIWVNLSYPPHWGFNSHHTALLYDDYEVVHEARSI